MAAPKKGLLIEFTVDGDSFDLELNREKLPLRERIEIEEYLGMPWSELLAGNWFLSEKGSAFLAYLAVRRRRKTVTLADILDAKELKVEIDPKRPTKKTTRATSGTQS